ncbi:LMF2 [Symbiodinium natans]|uniref:LMF2 protein n=1 Tax=Symbiodinium natans TaxID=878477 RepID=A0A812KYT9_9DINO|nr:LMF2 [Symbiodinium natans]
MEGRSPSCLEAEAEELTSEASLNSEVSRALATASGDEVADGSPEDSLEDSTDDGLKDRPSSDLKLSPLRNDVQASSLCSLLRAASAGTSQGLKFAEARIGPWVEEAMHWEPNQLLAGAVHFSYFMLFASLYTQLPGLHGPQGIDPYHLSKGLNDSLLLRHGRRGRYWAAELAALLGLGASGAATALPALRSGWTGLTLSGVEWLLWRDFMVSGASSFPMGMTYLAMEGSIGAAAFALNAPRLASWFWRWCLFRGLLAGGAHKLLLCDASWNNLSAVHWHFQGNPNPSALSWYAFRLTSSYPSLGHLATASTLAIEMVAPFLFFSPNRGLRMLGLAGNSLLQLGILASGNYGPLNFYFLALGLSLLQSERRRQLADTDASRAVEEDTVWPAAAVGLGSVVAIGAATRLLPTSPATCPSAGHAVYAQLTASWTELSGMLREGGDGA